MRGFESRSSHATNLKLPAFLIRSAYVGQNHKCVTAPILKTVTVNELNVYASFCFSLGCGVHFRGWLRALAKIRQTVLQFLIDHFAFHSTASYCAFTNFVFSQLTYCSDCPFSFFRLPVWPHSSFFNSVIGRQNNQSHHPTTGPGFTKKLKSKAKLKSEMQPSDWLKPVT